jgi:hypothetical protein
MIEKQIRLIAQIIDVYHRELSLRIRRDELTSQLLTLRADTRSAQKQLHDYERALVSEFAGTNDANILLECIEQNKSIHECRAHD